MQYSVKPILDKGHKLKWNKGQMFDCSYEGLKIVLKCGKMDIIAQTDIANIWLHCLRIDNGVNHLEKKLSSSQKLQMSLLHSEIEELHILK